MSKQLCTLFHAFDDSHPGEIILFQLFCWTKYIYCLIDQLMTYYHELGTTRIWMSEVSKYAIRQIFNCKLVRIRPYTQSSAMPRSILHAMMCCHTNDGEPFPFPFSSFCLLTYL